MPGVESACYGVLRLDIDADVEGLLLSEPIEDGFGEVIGNAFAAMFSEGVDPLELALASETGGEVAGDESDDGMVFESDPDGAIRKCLLRGAASDEIVADARRPELPGLPLAGADGGHGEDIFGLSGADQSRDSYFQELYGSTTDVT